MQVMYVHPDPATAASMLPDQHVSKLATEAAQIVSTVAHLHGCWSDTLYKPTHVHHGITVLAADNDRSLAWLLAHGRALVREHWFRRRTDAKHRRTIAVLDAAAAALGVPHDADWRNPPVYQAMPDNLRHEDPVVAYRCWARVKACDWHEAGRPARFTRRDAPDWYIDTPYRFIP